MAGLAGIHFLLLVAIAGMSNGSIYICWIVLFFVPHFFSSSPLPLPEQLFAQQDQVDLIHFLPTPVHVWQQQL